MKIAFQKKILGGFILCCIALIIVAVISFKNSEQFVDTNQWVNHSHEVLYELEQILVNAVEAETGTRGFVTTGDEDYLMPFNDSKENLSAHVEKARNLMSDNPAQSKNLAALEQLTEEHLNHLDKCIGLRREDYEKARELIRSGESRRILNEIRSLIRNAREIEQALLVKRKQASEDDIRNFNIIFMVLLTVIAIVLVIIYFIIVGNLKALRRSERETEDKNWTLAGGGELTKGMQGNKQLGELSQAIINHLATT